MGALDLAARVSDLGGPHVRGLSLVFPWGALALPLPSLGTPDVGHYNAPAGVPNRNRIHNCSFPSPVSQVLGG